MQSRTVVFAVLLGALVGLGACSPPVRSERMAPAPTEETQFVANSPLRGGVAIKDIGGGEPTTEDSNIGDEQLRQAVQDALQQYGLLLSDGAPARFRLSVTLVKLSQPGGGLDLTASAQIRYTLTRADTGVVLFNDVIAASYTATMGDEFIAMLRLRLAKEGAIRANLAAFFQRLKALPVSGPPKQAAELAQ